MIYFVSDAHLGSLVIADPEQHQARFVRLLQQMQQDADEVFLLGDIFDFWHEYFWPDTSHLEDRFQPTLDALLQLSKKCRVHFFIGNHDLWTHGWLAKRTGMIVHYEAAIFTLNGKKCYLAHGDGLGSTDKAFLILRKVFHNKLLQACYRILPPTLGDKIGYHWAAASRRKELQHPHPYLGEQQEDLLRFARRYEAKHPEEHIDYYIFGHRHIELAFMLPTRACVYILGDFFQQFTYAEMQDGVITLQAQDSPIE